MEFSNQNNRKQNKGFTIHLGDDYVGYLVIGEKNVSPEQIGALQNPVNMKAVLAQGELREFAEPEQKTSSSIMDVIAKASAPAPSES